MTPQYLALFLMNPCFRQIRVWSAEAFRTCAIVMTMLVGPLGKLVELDTHRVHHQQNHFHHHSFCFHYIFFEVKCVIILILHACLWFKCVFLCICKNKFWILIITCFLLDLRSRLWMMSLEFRWRLTDCSFTEKWQKHRFSSWLWEQRLQCILLL